MRAICPTCDTAYTIPDGRIGPAGRKVRCTRCGEEWRVMPVIEDLAAQPVEEPLIVRTTALPPLSEESVAAAMERLDPSLFPSAPAAAPDIEPPAVAASAPAPAEPDGPPVAAPRAADVRIRFKPRKPRLSLTLPRMPVALTRAAPFFGPLVFVSACLVLAGLLAFRATVVTAAPGLAGFYAMLGLEVNLRGLTFGPVETLREIDNGQPVLVVEGTLTNPTQKLRDVPALRFALRDGDAQELYAWSIDPKATTIAAGDSLRFRTRLVAPPERATDIQLRFVERRNQQARLP